jgi:hypothetical protein
MCGRVPVQGVIESPEWPEINHYVTRVPAVLAQAVQTKAQRIARFFSD